MSGWEGPELPPELDETFIVPCCMGAAVGGLSSCTCWEPIFDLEQATPNVATLRVSIQQGAQLCVVTRPRCCGDCAYRNDSPERRDGRTDELLDIAGSARFFCHQGMRRVIGWKHPVLDPAIEAFFVDGMLPAGAGDYRPPIIDAVAFKADGQPADLCAGWNAHRWALLEREVFDDPTQRVEATTTPEGAKGWETGQARHDVPAGGHGLDVAPDASPEGVRAETRRLDDRAGGEPSNAPIAAR